MPAIFPTPVGVFLRSSSGTSKPRYLPHTRGGVSIRGRKNGFPPPSSPHPWGCFRFRIFDFCSNLIFPTPVGVFPFHSRLSGGFPDLPHTRGGVSKQSIKGINFFISSPHPWGCFSLPAPCFEDLFIFPTPVGVFPKTQRDAERLSDLPHTRGGVSFFGRPDRKEKVSSPHPWGCFSRQARGLPPLIIFPTPVGVFLDVFDYVWSWVYLPHTRGGVSDLSSGEEVPVRSSPHPWGCFFFSSRRHSSTHIFPTPVGVFRYITGRFSTFIYLPHTRGGVSRTDGRAYPEVRSSPHPWGCFFVEPFVHFFIKIFPTPVGVFLCSTWTSRASSDLPHTRGGVSFPKCNGL